MPSKRSEPPLRIELKPSRRMLLLLWFIHGGGALLFSVFIQLPWVAKGMVLLLLAISLAVSLYKTGWLQFDFRALGLPLRWQPVPMLVWQGDNDWQLVFGDGTEVLAQLLPASTCQPFMVALNFRTEKRFWLDRYLSVVIFADAIDAEIFRRLRIRLRTRFVPETSN